MRTHEARVLVNEWCWEAVVGTPYRDHENGHSRESVFASRDLAGKKPNRIADATIGGEKANRCVRFEWLS